jgi:AcrR family transcriptional regulator
MTSREESRARVVDLLVAHVLATGLARTGVRQLAAAAGISDRMLLYYFDDKAEVMRAVMRRLIAGLSAELAILVPETPRLSTLELVRRASAMTIGPEMAPFMRLWIEILAEAARGEAPYVEIAWEIAAGFTDWILSRLEPVPGADMRALASAVLAMLDGLALLGVCAPKSEVEAAARALGEGL